MAEGETIDDSDDDGGTRRRLARVLGPGLVGVLVGLGIAFAVIEVRRDDDAPRAAAPAAAQPAGPIDNSFHPVAGNFVPDGKKLSDCGGDGRCYEQAFGNLAHRIGPKPALKRFAAEIQRNPAVEANCHRIAHTIGSAALTREEGNVGRAFVQGDATCGSGYYHGILEHALQDVRGEDALAEAAKSLCADESVRRTDYVAYQCVHGLGHGLMIQTGLDLPTSLATCDRLATDWDQIACTGGVFMENISTSYGVKSRWLKDDDLIYPCNDVEERHKLYCYLMVTARILAASKYDFAVAAKICRTQAEAAWIDVCFQSFGRDASGLTRQNPARVAELCRLAQAHETDCFFGAAKDFVNNYADTAKAGDLCRSAPRRAVRERCFNGVGEVVAALSRDQADWHRLCDVAVRPSADARSTSAAGGAGRDRAACLKGTGLG